MSVHHTQVTPLIKAFFDPPTFTVSYLVVDPDSRLAAVVDPVMDYDHASGQAHHRSASKILEAARDLQATVAMVLETHVHADHLSAAQWLKQQTGARVLIGAQVAAVQKGFAPLFSAHDLSLTGAEFDHLVVDGETFALGSLTIEAIHTPGHTPACVSWKIGPEDVFVGDTLFMPDYGTARADFPGGDAATLYRSIQKLLALPASTRLWMCHDYKAPGRDYFAWQTTVEEQRRSNVHVRSCATEEQFVAMRQARDKTLSAPALLLPSVQVNMRAGRLPRAATDGRVYLQIPVSIA
jgi:glyoxylase-like metal-dependent hydrolase (beta-lactamase superfamily II)